MRWGVLGTGAVADAFVTGLSFVDGASLAVVGSRTVSRAHELAARHGGGRGVGSYEEVVGDPSVDVVYVATGNEHHVEHALLAIEAGKPVLCEKPFALDAAGGRRVADAARRAGVFCMEAMWMRCSPAVQEVQRRVQAGDIGDVRLVSAQLGFPNDVDPASRLFAGAGGGALLDLGVYPVSFAHALLGRPTSVTSTCVVGATGVDEQVAAVLDHGDGRQAIVAAGIRCQLANSASVHGTLGVLRLDAPLVFPARLHQELVPVRRAGSGGGSTGWKARLRQHPAGRVLAEQRHRLRTRSVTLRAPGNGYSAEAVEVERCLAAGLLESPVMTLEATIEVLETMDEIRAGWAR